MLKITSAISPRARLLGFVGLAFAATLMMGCTEDEKPTTSNACGSNNELCVTRAALVDTGTALFAGNCSGCHGEAGNGQGHGAPVIANSDFVMGSHERLVKTLLKGLGGNPITVNGKTYSGSSMPAWEDAFTNHEIAGLATYIRSVLNDSLVSNCVADPNDAEIVTCTKVARIPADVLKDTVPVWFVKAVRDTL